MNQSENINELAMALSKAQGEMQAAKKDSENPFFKSKYADLNSIWDSARPVLSKNGLCVIQTTDMANDKIILITTLAHTSGQWIKSIVPLNPSKNDSQGVGAAMTYLRRYSLSAMIGIVTDEDDDGESAVGRGKTKTKEPILSYAECVAPKKISIHQVLVLKEMYMKVSDELRQTLDNWMNNQYQTKDLESLAESDYEGVRIKFNNCLKYFEDQKNK